MTNLKLVQRVPWILGNSFTNQYVYALRGGFNRKSFRTLPHDLRVIRYLQRAEQEWPGLYSRTRAVAHRFEGSVIDPDAVFAIYKDGEDWPYLLEDETSGIGGGGYELFEGEQVPKIVKKYHKYLKYFDSDAWEKHMQLFDLTGEPRVLFHLPTKETLDDVIFRLQGIPKFEGRTFGWFAVRDEAMDNPSGEIYLTITGERKSLKS